MGGDPAQRDIFDGREGYKVNIVFSELRDCVHEGFQGPAGHFGSQSK